MNKRLSFHLIPDLLNRPSAILKFAAFALITKVTVEVIVGYRVYFPAQFDSDFLHGREAYFHEIYQYAFYTHILSGPPSLLVGLILLSEAFRRRHARWHRYLGRFQTFNVLFLLTPSGLFMARHSATGAIAALGFSTLSLATAACVALGWRAAVTRRFRNHERWMWRGYLLLCSAVVLRLIGGLATIAGIGADWVYSLAAWASWLLPLLVFEVMKNQGVH